MSPNNIENLSTEIFTEILSHLSTHDKSSLCQISHQTHDRIIPDLYASWEYHAHTHSFRSLHCFLRTVIQNPEIAGYVRMLDVRDWGDVPWLEDYVGMPGESEEGEEDEEEHDDEEGEERSDVNSKNESTSTSSNYGPTGGISDEDYEKDFSIINQAVLDLNFGEEWENELRMAIRERKDGDLIALLILKLPNLRKLYTFLPDAWDSEGKYAYGIPGLVTKVAETGSSMLDNLQTIYACSALHIGIKGHREYDLELYTFKPLLNSKSLRSLYLLSPFTTGYPGHDLHYPGATASLLTLQNTSPIQTLTLDQPASNPLAITALIRIPVTLKSLSLYQRIHCFSLGSCWHPIAKLYGQTIRTHRKTLEFLDLDIRRSICRRVGHAYNPRAEVSDKLDMYIENPAGDEWTNGHLIGSFRDFGVLRSLAINVDALCGDHEWGQASYQLREILPESLETLKLYLTMIYPAASRALEFQNKPGWLSQAVDFVERAEMDHPRFKELVILTRFWAQKHPDVKENLLFKDLVEACKIARIGFEEVDAPLEGPRGKRARVPWFREVEATQNPGRDF